MEQKFTTLAQEAISDAVQNASAAGNAQVETCLTRCCVRKTA